MAVRDDFAAGEVLAAADLNDTFASKVDYATPTNAQAGTAYTFVADDAERLTTASNGSAVTFTIPPQSSVAWGDNTILRIVNYGAGDVTVDGGSGVTVTNTATTIAQYSGAQAIRTASDAWTLVPFGGGKSAPATVEYLVIAGGAGGGDFGQGGGGGAGGYRCSVVGENSGGGASAESVFVVTPGTGYTVTVGAGGAAGQPQSTPGSNSVFATITSIGGGAAGGGGGASGGGTGGSGGGGSRALAGGSGTANQGYAGGTGTLSPLTAGGGGGAGGAGGNVTAGVGVASSISGSSVTRAAGGTGNQSGAQSAASANTGNGGNGSTDSTGGTGGSGVVIIRHPDTDAQAVSTTGSPTITTSGGYVIYTFTASGTITW